MALPDGDERGDSRHLIFTERQQKPGRLAGLLLYHSRLWWGWSMTTLQARVSWAKMVELYRPS